MISAVGERGQRSTRGEPACRVGKTAAQIWDGGMAPLLVAHLDVELANVLGDLLFRERHAALIRQLQRKALGCLDGLFNGDLT